MKARFIGSGEPGENRECEVFGLVFPLDEWVEVSGLAASKLRGNPTFEVDVDDDGEADQSNDELRAQLDALGVKYHHKAGTEKLKAALADHLAANPDPETPEEDEG